MYGKLDLGLARYGSELPIYPVQQTDASPPRCATTSLHQSTEYALVLRAQATHLNNEISLGEMATEEAGRSGACTC